MILADAPPRSFNLVTKPAGPSCNLSCRYCFYLEKAALYEHGRLRMTDALLERYIQQYIESQHVPEITFSWQGGEPLLMGIAFFRRAVELQKKHLPAGKRVHNALQTNGTLIDADWCRFFQEHSFLIGISIDGPRALHDAYRVDRGGRPTFDRIVAAITLLKEHDVEFNTLTVVHRQNSKQPLEVYELLKSLGSTFHQYIPLVERAAPTGELFRLASPPGSNSEAWGAPVTAWSVEPAAYGEFLVRIFDEWIRKDVGQVFVQLFEEMLGIALGRPASLCYFSETCGEAMALEHNGDLYACDHYVYPEYKRGNIGEESLETLAGRPEQRRFGAAKRDTLTKYCLGCEVRLACNGDCPKHRFMRAPTGEPGLSYLCQGHKLAFKHMGLYLQALAGLLRGGHPAAAIQKVVAQRDLAAAEQRRWTSASRNDSCPCGSGKKFKRCCWTKVTAFSR